ncbi:MAG TPA: hypothetical protein PLZ01_06860 [bacterium]|nr:hypothetical protein [bacterium]
MIVFHTYCASSTKINRLNINEFLLINQNKNQKAWFECRVDLNAVQGQRPVEAGSVDLLTALADERFYWFLGRRRVTHQPQEHNVPLLLFACM